MHEGVRSTGKVTRFQLLLSLIGIGATCCNSLPSYVVCTDEVCSGISNTCQIYLSGCVDTGLSLFDDVLWNHSGSCLLSLFSDVIEIESSPGGGGLQLVAEEDGLRAGN